MKRKFSQKGISLFLAVIILTIILAIVLGLSTILIGQIKMIRGMGNSVVALYAADTGIEQVLKVVIDYVAYLTGGPAASSPGSSYSETQLDNWAFYRVEVVCCDFDTNDQCYFDGSESKVCPIPEDLNCEATYFCIRSVGTFRDVQRAIEVKVYPID